MVYEGEDGVVEEIGLTYTFIRTPDHDRIVVPNEKLVSDTIRNSTIRAGRRMPRSTCRFRSRPTSTLLVVEPPRGGRVRGDASVFVSSLNGTATVTMLAAAGDEDSAAQLERDLRLRAHGRLRALGIGNERAAPPYRRRRPTAESGTSGGRRRRQRTRARKRQSRRLLLLTIFVGLPIAVLVAAAIAGTAVSARPATSTPSQPVEIGENSFVYAADGSLLGSIPAERNREPVLARGR